MIITLWLVNKQLNRKDCSKEQKLCYSNAIKCKKAELTFRLPLKNGGFFSWAHVFLKPEFMPCESMKLIKLEICCEYSFQL